MKTLEKNLPIILFWILLLSGVTTYFHFFATYTFCLQEGGQLFIPSLDGLLQSVAHPEGLCQYVSRWLTQWFFLPFVALATHTLLVFATGIICFRIFRTFAKGAFSYLATLLPTLYLLYAHTLSIYRVDGTVALLLVLVALDVTLRQQARMARCVVSALCAVLLFWMVGQAVAVFGVLSLTLGLLGNRREWPILVGVCVLSVALAWFGVTQLLQLPLTDGIYSFRYQTSQFAPTSLYCYVWLRFSCWLAGAALVAFACTLLADNRNWGQYVVGGLYVVAVGVEVVCYLLNPLTLRDEHTHRLWYLEQHARYDELLASFQDVVPQNLLELNLQNLALAKTGQLAENMFRYPQAGLQGLLSAWDKTTFSSTVLCEIHQAIGDHTIAESYAFELQSTSRHGGHPAAIQLLAHNAQRRGDSLLVRRYLKLLGQMPHYRKWSADFPTSRDNPSHPMDSIHVGQSDSLFSLMSVDSLWMRHVAERPVNRIATEYLGCSYLLARELDKFRGLLFHLIESPDWESLPRHFQEAAILVSKTDQPLSRPLPVATETVKRFLAFSKDLKQGRSLESMQRLYGDTYWFYYYNRKKQ
ncbi:MAG: DUF6057 family protein [Bacteroidales bacterium]|nr:DUF6057 family protein [Bacteroidales bacterium]